MLADSIKSLHVSDFAHVPHDISMSVHHQQSLSHDTYIHFECMLNFERNVSLSVPLGQMLLNCAHILTSIQYSI